MKPLIYVAGPYTLGDPVLNTRRACEMGERVREVGATPIVPHLFHLWHLVAPKDYRFWMELDLDYLDHCHAIFRLVGQSKGADEEVAKMREAGKRVIYEPNWGELNEYINEFTQGRC